MSGSKMDLQSLYNTYSTFHCKLCPFLVTDEVFMKKHLMEEHLGSILSGEKQKKPSKERARPVPDVNPATAAAEASVKEDIHYGINPDESFMEYTVDNHVIEESRDLDPIESIPDESDFHQSATAKSTPNRRSVTFEKYECNLCDYSCPSRWTMEKHSQAVHQKVKPHKCPDCGKGFVSKKDLRRHVECVHLGQRAFKCGLCGKAFSAKHSLQRHNLKPCPV